MGEMLIYSGLEIEPEGVHTKSCINIIIIWHETRDDHIRTPRATCTKIPTVRPATFICSLAVWLFPSFAKPTLPHGHAVPKQSFKEGSIGTLPT